MRLAKSSTPPPEMDMTPMIDMTFQLIAFFMIALNFSEAEQDQRIKLPASILALPPEGAAQQPITLQLTKQGTVLFGGEELTVEGVGGPLARERQVMERLGTPVSDSTIIVRADAAAESGRVQDLIKLCQQNGFEKFVLRAQQEQPEQP